MYKNEWKYLKKIIDECLIDPAQVLPYQNIREALPTVIGVDYDDQNNQHNVYSDFDYNEGQIISIQIGPFDHQKQAETHQCLDRVMKCLEENGYLVQDIPFGTITDGQTTWTIRFKRTKKASLHLCDEEDEG